MTPGLTRKAATVELTRETVGNQNDTGPPLSSVAMSAGGRYLAITTIRTRFALPALQLLGEPRPVPGPRELYVVDLQNRTLERATHSLAGGDINASVLDGPTISADGQRVAFASFAGDLFFGDANQRADAFVATRQPDAEAEPPQQDATGDSGTTIEVDREGPRIAVRAKSNEDGTIILTVSVPAAGGTKAIARGRAGSPRKLRTLSTGSARARGLTRSEVRILLRPVDRYQAELQVRERIPARVTVGYVASRGGRRASASVKTVFRHTSKGSKRARK